MVSLCFCRSFDNCLKMKTNITIIPLLLLAVCTTVNASALAYNVHWLGGPTTVDREVPIINQKLDIYCHTGTSKSIFSLWQTIRFHIKIKNDEFSQYLGSSPEDVFKKYTEDSYGWAAVYPFQRRTQRTIYVDLFSPTCMAINTKLKHSIELQVIRVDLLRTLCTILGLMLIFLARSLSGNPVFFYLCGIFVGVFASFMILVYYISKLLPRKTLTYGLLIGGWTVGVYLLQQVWDNILSIVRQHQTAAFWYTVVVGFASFLVCYSIGPPRNERSQNLVMWTLQAVGVLMVFFSSQYQEASAAIVGTALLIKYFPRPLLRRIQGYWRRRFPPKRRLLTNEEYYEQGARETNRALEELRKYCSSPECDQWNIMLKLSDPTGRRFASFVEGNSHLSDAEIMDYEAYAYSRERKKRREFGSGTPGSQAQISDDDDDDDDDDDNSSISDEF